MSAYITQKEIQRLKKGKWEHHAGRMSIESRDGTKAIRGPGFIRQIEQHCFQIVIFDVSQSGGPKENLLSFFQDDGKQAGELIPSGEGYELTTEGGWQSREVTTPNPYFTAGASISTAYTREIFRETKRHSQQGKAGVSFMSFYELKGYPCNKTITFGKYFEGQGGPGKHVCGAEAKGWAYDVLFWVHDGESHLQLTTSRKKKVHNDAIESRGIEALEFVLGTPIEWNTKTVYDSKMRRVHIRLVPSFPTARMHQPYVDDWTPGSPAFASFWKLYDKYLRFILEDRETGYSKIGSLLRNLAFLRSQDLSAYGLYLSVVIEEFVNNYFCREFEDKELDSVLPSVLEAVRETLKTREGNVKDRIVSHIGSLKRKHEYPRRALLSAVSSNTVSRFLKNS